MDGCRIEQKKGLKEVTPRPPLGLSEKNNAVSAKPKPRTREIASRYKSGISSAPASTPNTPRRCPSPTVSWTSTTTGDALPKRAQSAERRRPSTPSSRSSVHSSPSSSRPSTPSSPSSRITTPACDTMMEMTKASRRFVSGRTPDGLWPSMRSLSSFFHSESVSIHVAKKDKVVRSASPDHTLRSSANVVSERKRTPRKGRNNAGQSENAIPAENSHSRIVDQHRWPAMLGGKVSANSLTRSMDFSDRATRSASLPIQSRGVSPKRTPVFDSAARGLSQSRSEISRKVSLDVGGRVGPDLDSGPYTPSQPAERGLAVPRPIRTQSSPIPGLHRPSSPNRTLSTPSLTSRRMQSPSRTRPSTPSSTAGRAGSTPSVVNYMVDVRRGKKSANHIEDVHQLRLLYNRGLQWRFVNAQAEDTLSIQKIGTEVTLYGVWNTISELCDSVIMKRINVQHLRLEMKLYMILREQISYLEEWATLEGEHCNLLTEASEALKASTLQLPVTGGARVDVRAMKNSVSSAVDVMQAMGSSICFLLSKVEGTKALVSELSAVAAKERALLEECRELLASAAALQVQESSLRTQLVQLRQDQF